MGKQKQCEQCLQYADKFGRKYRGKRYCMDCYLYFFVKRACSHCGELKRIHRDEKKPLCYRCYSAITPCVRCHRVGRPVGRIESFGLLCNSCANVVLKPYRKCSMCGKSSRLSIDKKNGTNKPICQSCRYKMYAKCPQCGIKAALYKTSDGRDLCYRCVNGIHYYCSKCGAETYRSNKTLCQRCQACNRNDKRTIFNAELLGNSDIRAMFVDYVAWLTVNVGPAKAASVQNSYFDFFEALQTAPDDWERNVEFLTGLDGGHFRKSSLLKRYLDSLGINCDPSTLKAAMDLRTIHKNISTVLTLCPLGHQFIITEFFNERIAGYKKHRIKLQTIRVESSSIKRLYEHWAQSNDLNTAIRQLAAETPGTRCSLTKYINFATPTIQLTWPSVEASTEYRLAYLTNKYRYGGLTNAELQDYVKCFLFHFYGVSVTTGAFSIASSNSDITALFNHQKLWIAKP
ncbi:hypothetical protein DEU29_11557 [Idiomarina aquatica]|uniref:Uncharacterized protein n=1 Tax=Idiomarina aquatica TaxID=1327752 RepID=A0A4R6NZH5_9GAMM|nr:hypothetical protein DEU29_11557 [Idiomarina aquatica]